MDKNEIRLCLPSNVTDYNVLATNKTATYITQLERRYSLEGDWEIALQKISYTVSWYNVQKDQKIKFFKCGEGKIDYMNVFVTLRAGYYQSIEELVDYLNESLRKPQYENISFDSSKVTSLIFPRIEFKPWSGLIFIYSGRFNNKYIFMDIPEELINILGFEKNFLKEKLKFYSKHVNILFNELKQIKMPASQPVDLHQNLRVFYVYCDLVKPSPVGNKLVPFLRDITTNTDSSYGKQVEVKDENPIYYPVLHNEFSTVEINICDELGNPMPFQFGRVVVSLHLRKKN